MKKRGRPRKTIVISRMDAAPGPIWAWKSDPRSDKHGNVRKGAMGFARKPKNSDEALSRQQKAAERTSRLRRAKALEIIETAILILRAQHIEPTFTVIAEKSGLSRRSISSPDLYRADVLRLIDKTEPRCP